MATSDDSYLILRNAVLPLALEAWEASRDGHMVRAVLLRDQQATPTPQFWRALILADLDRPQEAATAFAAGQRRLNSGPLPGWDFLQATTSIYVAHALRLEAEQVFKRKRIPLPER